MHVLRELSSNQGMNYLDETQILFTFNDLRLMQGGTDRYLSSRQLTGNDLHGAESQEFIP
jgi:hypothetical protein